MIEVKGYAAYKPKSELSPYSFSRKDPGEHDVLIEIKYCGICHSDIHQVQEDWGTAIFPMVPGHEIAGIVTKIGNKVTQYKVGDKVGVGCLVDSCRLCDSCEKNLEQFCEEGATFTYNSLERDTKNPTFGGYSENIVVNENYVLKIPDNLPLDAAAPLLCAGITLYSPLKHWNIGPGKKVAIIGLGGIGHMGVKLAHALGAEVTVLSHSLKKQEDAKRFGANHFYATSNPETFKKLQKYFDVIINTVSVEMNWDDYLKLLKIDGAMVLLGLPKNQITLSPSSLTNGRKILTGSLIGGIKETQEMLNFCGKHNITCEIELIPIQKVNEAYERVMKSDVRYRFVIDIASLKK